MAHAERPTVVALIGPTAVGKTALSLELAENLSCHIVSADSRQLYAGMTIGTAAPTPEELSRVKHHFIGTLDPGDYYSAAKYAEEALALLTDDLLPRHHTALLTGGSMMYIDAVCNGIDDIPTIDSETRAMMQQRYRDMGLEGLQQELRVLDPEYYRIVDLKNHKRVIHALEICYMTGRTFTSFRTHTRAERPFRIVKIGLDRERGELFDRINRRVDLMMENGLLEEAGRLYPLRHLNALNTVGYKELFAYIDGHCTLDEAVEKIKRNTRVYAKKQLTWFKRDTAIKWYHPDQKEWIWQEVCQAVRHGGE